MFIEFGGTLLNIRKVTRFVIEVDGETYYDCRRDEYDINKDSEIYIAAYDESSNTIETSENYLDVATAQYELKKLYDEIKTIQGK